MRLVVCSGGAAVTTAPLLHAGEAIEATARAAAGAGRGGHAIAGDGRVVPMLLTGTRGMVASTHWLASAAGMAMLDSGGNAFDAAVTAGFVLQVVEPHLCGPGGEVPAILSVAGGPPRVLCGVGVAPAGATIGHYRDALGLDVIPGDGLLAACVPGAWDGWLTLLRDHGTRTLREVLGPAIGYARDGFPLIPGIAATIALAARRFEEHWPTSAAQWLPAPRAGARFRLPVLADTWERLLRAGEAAGAGREAQLDAARSAWSSGFVAHEVDAFCRQAFRDASGRDHAGVLTAEDLAGWQASYEDPLVAPLAGGWSLVKCGRWTQGPALLQQAQLLGGFELSYVDGLPTAETVHLAVECAKLAFADREAWYGDSADRAAFEALLEPSYVDGRRALVGLEASAQLRPGSPGGRQPRLPQHVLSGRGIGGYDGQPPLAAELAGRGDTVHLDVVDAAGNMISATPSGGWLQSSPAIPALGFCLGTRAQMCWLEEGLPSSLVPGRRPRITLSPSMALRDGVPVLAFGTPGGDQQDQWQLCFWLAHTAGGLDLQAAIDAPAWHSASFPSSFYPRAWRPRELTVESRLGPAVIDALRARGHLVVDAGPWSLGRLSAVSRDPASGLLYGAANPRGSQGYAVGC
jgi:gamma-glutamyltranspeptidase/glutathione hydrolase